VLFASPYEAAAWSILSSRQAMRVAARIKRRLADELGESGAFPLPQAILAAPEIPGVSGERAARLRGIAEAALGGRLDPALMRAVPPEKALAALQTIRGIVRDAARRAYDLHELDDTAFERLAEAWRPYRSWVAFRLRVDDGD
jgi:3-methyladenine DNA glycosylase/8-oxoguanine DNA glycosylase